MEPIENVILDMGGVLLDLDERATYQAFVRLGLKSVPQDLAEANLDFQRGKLSARQFADYLRRYLPEGVSREQVCQAWCAMLGEVPERRREYLRQLGRRYRLFLLSNTDDIHIECLRTRMDLEDFERLFERVYYSQRTGFRKPESGIFRLVLTDNSLDASRTLFVDDSRENVDGARSVGLQARWLDLSHESFEHLAQELLSRKS